MSSLLKKILRVLTGILSRNNAAGRKRNERPGAQKSVHKRVRTFTFATAAVLIVCAVGYGVWLHAHNRQMASSDYQHAVLFSKPQAPGPLLLAYQQKVQAALASDQPIMTLSGLDTRQSAAQQAAVAHPDMQAAAHDKDTGQALRAQVFQVNDLPKSDASGTAADCKTMLQCYVVEIYYYATNSTGKVVVGVKQADDSTTVLSSDMIAYSQPELPLELTAITKELIRGSQELKDTLHEQVDVSKLTMVNGKTALKATRCERSEHLCVAPTLAEADEAYWIIVDMTDDRIVGVTWTRWSDKVPDVPPSEQHVIDTAITQKYCGVDTDYNADGWKFAYTLTGSDGLEVKQVSYKGVDMMASVKNTDWHVSYSHQAGFGYSDAVGCPVFSTAAVVPATEPKISDLTDSDGKKIGFELVQEFKSKLWPQPCNYYYQQRFQFFDDGSFRPAVANLGRGCGDDGTYRPVTRIQPATGFTAMSQWDGSQWQTINKEQWEKDSPGAPLPETEDGNRYQLVSGAGKLDMSLGRGQFNDGGHGDNPWVYIDKFHADKDEGSSDIATLGSCCNMDYKQGPDIFTNNESLTGQPLLLWYVSEQKNNGTPGEEYCWATANIVNGVYKTNTYPCVSGPKFTITR